MTTFFTADHHFGHTNIIKFCKRPFSSTKEMDDNLIDAWNHVVSEKDVVYHLGDFTLFGAGKFVDYASQLNGRIRIVPGGHDFRWLKQVTALEATSRSGYQVIILDPLVSLSLPKVFNNKYSQIIVLCHFAMRVWDRSHHGAYHLYGHSHGTLPNKGRSLDVGVDTNNFYPYSLDEIHQILQKEQFGLSEVL